MDKRSHLAPYREDPEIRRFRTRAWLFAVLDASQLSVAALEREFSESGVWENGARSCIWQKYKAGSVVPRCGRRGNGSLNLVDRVESRYPGTATWLTLPLWRLADPHPLDMASIRATMEALPPRIRSYFILEPHEDEANRVFWRREAPLEQTEAVLRHFHTVDDFIAILALIREAEVAQDRARYQFWVESALDWLMEGDGRIGLPSDSEDGKCFAAYLYSTWIFEA